MAGTRLACGLVEVPKTEDRMITEDPEGSLKSEKRRGGLGLPASGFRFPARRTALHNHTHTRTLTQSKQDIKQDSKQHAARRMTHGLFP